MQSFSDKRSGTIPFFPFQNDFTDQIINEFTNVTKKRKMSVRFTSKGKSTVSFFFITKANECMLLVSNFTTSPDHLIALSFG